MRIPRREPIVENVPELPSFRLNYAMEALLSRGSIVKDQLFDHSRSSQHNVFFRRLIYTSQECQLACEECLDGALAAIDERRRICLFTFFEYLYDQKLNSLSHSTKEDVIGSFSDLPPNCILIRKVMATPLRLILLPPEVMMTNRVIRHFGEEYALRCVFRDDNGQRLIPKEFTRGRAVRDQSLHIQQLIYKTLSEGICIASRHYSFLAWSNSQMRDHGCYMFAPAKIVDKESGEERWYSIEDIRRWMGDFTASKSVPKLMSRMGQCFTQAQVFCSDQSLHIQQLIYKTLSEGICIASRHYSFLAWSNSQMRDHGCYMFAPAKIVDKESGEERWYSIEDIRRWMGDFTASKSVPKLMSRMGQCFTQAQPTILLERKDWRLEEDIVGGLCHPETKEKYTFSDGVGRISLKYAALVAAELDLRPVPSCFQVRFKGFKGVLCCDPSLDIEAREQIVFRKSQKKFDEDESESAELEVCEKQNRDIHQRLCWRVHCLLEKELNLLAAMLVDEETAAEALSSRLSLSIDFRQLHDNGFLFTNEPFFRSLLIAVHRYNIKLHLSKSKIFLPGSMGRTMYGVIDDTGVLQYGQVFIQYSPSVRNPSKKVITHIGHKFTPFFNEYVDDEMILGRVLVTKNPCLVGGDVRMFTAVYQPSLEHLRDVIVFPRYGPRPHTDEMAGIFIIRLLTMTVVSLGSDLDGDEYIVIFDKDLFLEHNENAMDFPKSVAPEYDSTPKTEDMVDFFLKYLSQDSIGRMSNAHLIMSDRLGLFDEICDGIARKCSIAVDFPKSGEPAEPLTSYEQSDVVPDFMQKSFKPSYRSNRLIGQLYRKVKKVENIVELAQTMRYDDSFDAQLYDESLFETHPTLIKNSIRLRDQYNTKLQQLMDEYGISDEASVVSGHSVTIRRITDMERDDYSYYHSDKIVELRYSRIYASFRREFFAEFGEESDFITVDAFGQRGIRWNTALITKAKVWYAVCYGKRAMCSKKFRSFPWIVWDLLLIVKRRILIALKQPSPKILNPISNRLSEVIEKFCAKNSFRMNAMLNELSSGPLKHIYFVEYTKRSPYGYKLAMLCFVIDNWLSLEGVYEQSVVRRDHVVTLFLQFGIGLLHGKHSSLDLLDQFTFLTPLSTEEGDKHLPVGDCTIFASIGDILISFIRYLASERFANASSLKMLMPVNLANTNQQPPSLILTKPYQWAMLNAVFIHHGTVLLFRFVAKMKWSNALFQVAFRTFHHLSLTSTFEALHLETSNGAEVWDFGESESPSVIAGDICVNNGVNLQRIISALKKWSGVKEIMCRMIRRDQLMVSSAGSIASRQCLQRLLLIDQNRLIDYVCSDKVPIEARNEYL
ncbi:unnamed protein product [Anisakis simplex]|uniref:RNA-dependent RNA polymerase n=1 Tax=Anisakis simplex TaxID=6269 RepID=A0A0M3K0K8_ANISI|nr:unnamed protein product [Anisakis simplex]